jgi:uncharacterized protein (TIGR01777 family)
MRVFITGGTGLIGRRLTERLIGRGDTPVLLSRHADTARRSVSMRGIQVLQGDPAVAAAWEAGVDGCDAVVNLAGHNLFADRWSPEVKRTIRDSRVYGTENVVAAMSRATIKPKVLVQASAIGYYGPTADQELTESSPPGSDFMARVCREWEEAAAPAAGFARLATIRTGVVLAKGEGALKVMTPIFKLMGSPIGGASSAFLPGTGRQWMSWIHLDDIVGLMMLALDHAEAQGPINGTAPNPVRNVDFGKALARQFHRPFFPFGPPDAMLSAGLGEVAQVVTKGQKVLPRRAQQLGYTFKYPELAGALSNLFAKPPKTQQAAKPATSQAAASAHH